jgi:hypothetical protein
MIGSVYCCQVQDVQFGTLCGDVVFFNQPLKSYIKYPAKIRNFEYAKFAGATTAKMGYACMMSFCMFNPTFPCNFLFNLPWQQFFATMPRFGLLYFMF